jgi:hypothetical protein
MAMDVGDVARTLMASFAGEQVLQRRASLD